MAIVKHNSSKSNDYSGAIQYLTMKFDEHLNQPILDQNGYLQERENYRISYHNPSGAERPTEEWESDCIKTNMKYNQNRDSGDVKTHMYIIAFDPKDGLSVDQVQQLGEQIATEMFRGHSYLVATHDNHAHIVLNSVRELEKEREEYMKTRSEYMAGKKHNSSKEFTEYLKQHVMELCRSLGLNQIDLLADASTKKTTNEIYAENAAATEDKLTQKEYCRQVISYAKYLAKSADEFKLILKQYEVEISKRGQNVRYKPVDGSKWIRDKSLGADYQTAAIVQQIAQNSLQKEKEEPEKLESIKEKIRRGYQRAAIQKNDQKGKITSLII